MRARLSAEDLAAVASAPSDATATELARRLGRPYKLVEARLRAIRRAGGWYSPVKLPPCTECGQPVVGPPKQKAHAACMPARRARWAREDRDRLVERASPDVLAEGRAVARERANRHYRTAPTERRKAGVTELVRRRGRQRDGEHT